MIFQAQIHPLRPKAISYALRGEALQLLPSRTMFWPKHSCLLIADVHLGKVSHFRKKGIGIPHRARHDNYVRIEHLLREQKPQRVLFLGDLFHSSFNEDWAQFELFMARHKQVSFELILGNHDAHNLQRMQTHLSKVYKEYTLGPFLLTHHPTPTDGLYNLCGHIHPSYRIYGKAKQSLKFPCFHFSPAFGTLPAFGTFTGSHVIDPGTEDDVFVVVENEVIKVK